MPEFVTSVIIPVFNQWQFTRACLKSLAETSREDEVIVIDNASTDATPQACPTFGEQLFGKAFKYIRNKVNLNFGPASNLGAKIAKGDFLLFLNNDTELLPGWRQPLIEDFSTYPDLGATGPLLLYPESKPFGHTVQHMGVYISPFNRVGHLYEGIPFDSPLVAKRRFFQVITAACMLIPKKKFLETGMFDENFINGFEDIDFCARLKKAGNRITINTAAKVIHYTSQTPGRHDHDNANVLYLSRKGINSLTPDLHIFVKNDGLTLGLTPWKKLKVCNPDERRLAPLAVSRDSVKIIHALKYYPHWEKGWQILLEKSEPQLKADLGKSFFKIFHDPFTSLDECTYALKKGDYAELSSWFDIAASFCAPLSTYEKKGKSEQERCARLGLRDLAKQYAAWLADIASFVERQYEPFQDKFREVALLAGIHLPSKINWQ